MESVVRKNSEYSHQWSLVWTYDNIGRKTSETQTIGTFTKTVSYEYDDASNTQTITYPGGKVIQKSYSAQQQLQKLEFNDAGTLSLIAEYGLEQTPEKTLTFANGVHRNDVYSAPGKLISRSYAKSGSEIWGMTLTHTADGKVESVQRNSAPDESFGYQADDQLTMAASGTIIAGAFSSSSYSAFSYDALGNRRSVDNNGVAVPYGVSSPSSSSVSSSSSEPSSSSEMAPAANSANQFDFAGENALTWNDRGDLTQFGDKSYSWDRMGRLASATDNATSSVLVRYEYDPLGRKIKRISPTEIIYFIYDGWQVIEEYTQATASDPVNLSKYHVYGQYIDELIATGIMNEATETIHYFHAGLNHNVEAITDASGSLVSYYTYDAFGSATEHPTSGTSGNNTLFQGREWDDQAGLYYFRNRWYSAELGRFISRDPIDFAAGDVNLYRFVGNGPVNGVDPWGLARFVFERGIAETMESVEWDMFYGINVLDFKLFFVPKEKACDNCIKIRFKQVIEKTNYPATGCTAPYIDPCGSTDPYFDDEFKDYILELQFPTYREGFSIFSNIKSVIEYKNSGIRGMHDRPGRVASKKEIYWRARTTITCVLENGKEESIGIIKWGFNISPSGEMTKWGPTR